MPQTSCFLGYSRQSRCQTRKILRANHTSRTLPHTSRRSFSVRLPPNLVKTGVTSPRRNALFGEHLLLAARSALWNTQTRGMGSINQNPARSVIKLQDTGILADGSADQPPSTPTGTTDVRDWFHLSPPLKLLLHPTRSTLVIHSLDQATTCETAG